MSSANPMQPDEIRALLDRAEERDLDDLEAKRLEEALAADPALLDEFLPPLPGEEHLQRDVELPTEFEWRRVDQGIEAGLSGAGLSGGASASATASGGVNREEASPRSSKSGPASLIPALALAAAVVLCALVVRMIVSDGLAAPEAPPVAEVLDLREGASTFIDNLGDDEDGGILIVVSSS